jgi:F-type H+-transporting ATPase subunit a
MTLLSLLKLAWAAPVLIVLLAAVVFADVHEGGQDTVELGDEPVVEIIEHGEGHAEDTEHAEHAEHEGPPHLPNLVTMVFGYESWAGDWVNVLFAFGIAIGMSVVSMRVYAKRKMIPGPLQNAVEMMVEGMYKFIESILGHETKQYLPFLGSLFFYILFMNWMGLVPLGHSPSTSLNITGSLAILTFLYAQYTGVKKLGIGGYLYHMAGTPKDAISWAMVILIFPLHIIGELAKPFSLALRLFGNITGEDTLVAVFVVLGIGLVAAFGISGTPVGLPLQVPFYFLGLLLSTIQALVFALLSTIYILLMLPHEEGEH